MNLLARFAIGQRLALGFGALLLLMLAMGALGAVALGRVHAAAEDVSVRWLASTFDLGEFRAAIQRARQAEAAHILSSAEDEYAAEEQRIADSLRQAAQAFGRYAARASSADERRLADTMAQARDRYVDVQSALVRQSRSADATTEENKAVYKNPSTAAFTALQATIDAALDYQLVQARAAEQGSRGVLRQATASTLALLLVSAAIGAGLAVAITRSITQPLAQALRVARSVAEGDLTSARLDVQGRDEAASLLRALRQMTDGLGRLVVQVRDSAQTLRSGSQHIAVGTADLKERSAAQSGKLEQTVVSVHGLTSTVRDNASTAQQACETAERSASAAREGGAVIGRVVQTMGDITQASRRIADIVGVIDGIAFQTNILALNAAVESARAGEHGRGFAVVAGEVRSLARRSAEAAREIKTLIAGSVEKIESGSILVAQAGRAMDEIVAQAVDVSALIGAISTASRSQTDGITGIGQAIAGLDEMTRRNDVLVRDSEAASQALRSQAATLADSVAGFKV